MLTRHIVTQSLWPQAVGGKDGDGCQFQVGPSPQVMGRDRRSGQEDLIMEENWEETNGVLGDKVTSQRHVLPGTIPKVSACPQRSRKWFIIIQK